jgi:hypothetical protein
MMPPTKKWTMPLLLKRVIGSRCIDMTRERCALDECKRFGVYYMGWEESVMKQHGVVCATHDRQIGRENIADWKPWMRRQKIVDWDNKFCRQPDWMGLEQYIYSVDPEWDK